MAKSKHAELAWIPVVRDANDGTLRIFCADNTAALAAVQAASERGLTVRRFKARTSDPAPILITVRDERASTESPTQPIPVVSMTDLVFGGR